MNLETFRRFLCDMYKMDLHHPVLKFVHRREFMEVSFQRWAIDELEQYVARHISNDSVESVGVFIDVVEDFRLKMLKFSRFNADTHLQFTMAAKVADSVLDLLNAMI